MTDYSPLIVLSDILVISEDALENNVDSHGAILRIAEICDNYRNQQLDPMLFHDMTGLFKSANKNYKYKYGKPLPYNQDTIRKFQIGKSLEAIAKDCRRINDYIPPVKPFRFEDYGA